MKFKMLICAVLTIGLCHNVFAYDKNEPTEFQEMHVQISNQTGKDCVSVQPAINVHGTYNASAPAASITSNDTKMFDMKQTVVYGPDVILFYRCGVNSQGADNNIQFEIVQPYAWIQGQTPTVEIKQYHGLALDTHVEGSSRFFHTMGQVIVTIKPNTIQAG